MTFQEYLDTCSYSREEFRVGTFEKKLFWCGAAPVDTYEKAMAEFNRLKVDQPFKDWRVVMVSTTMKTIEVPTSTSQVDPV